MVKLRIVGINTGEKTAFDGKFLAEYDPHRPGLDPDGRPMIAHVVATDDPAKAMEFADALEAVKCWRASSGRIRADGRPDCPLTAFTVEIA